MSKELERQGIPVAMISALPLIPLAVGANRVVRGVRVEHVCGDPSLSAERDRELSRRLILTALHALQTAVERPTLFEPTETLESKEVAHA
ncbi:MAG: hypothetical protein D6736_07895 [Nitrospinota bacterium]|nr:MAG: hypothetical protein D6736_07895 [Nitrospinota bacterium]